MSDAAAAPTAVEGLQLLADPQRWDILRRLGESDLRVSELVTATGRAQNLVSYHLGALRSAGLVSSRRSSADGRDTYYRIEHERCATLLARAVGEVHPAFGLVPSVPTWSARGRRPRVLFLCTGNSARSQIAQALTTHHSGGAVDARSAGSHPKPLHPNAVKVLAERGIDIAGRRTTSLDRHRRTRFDRVVTLCDKVKEVCPEWPGSTAAHWSMADPSASGEDDSATYPAFVATADQIDARVRVLLARLALATQEAP